jgi:hypothetical protein
MYEGQQMLQKTLVLRVYKDHNTITQVAVTSALGFGSNGDTVYITKKHPFFNLVFSFFNTLDNLFGFLG